MTLHEDGMLWQLLKGYANEDWDHQSEPWPAPADAFLKDASAKEARSLADELATIQSLGLENTGWRALLDAAEVDLSGLNHDLVAWAADLHDRATTAASTPSPN
ncbi:MAG: hypothetical protein ACKVH0_16870 [Alphaproteobacteria bacterium]